MRSRKSGRRLRPPLDVEATWFPILVFAFVFLVELGVVLRFNDGHVVYTLDDAYIHLALAENILRGHYGVNLGEYSAPSSSIAWPFLIAPFQAFSRGDLAPLSINFLLAIPILVLLRAIVLEAFPPERTGLSPAFANAAVVLLVPATNLVGLTFTGMEHSLHLLLVLLLLLGILRSFGGREVPGWLLPVVVLGPLVRYESLPLSGGALVFLVWRRRFASALTGAALIALCVGGFSVFLGSLELGHLPTSVLAKTPHLSPAASATDLLSNLKRNLTDRQGALLWVGVLWLVYAASRKGKSAEERFLAAWAAIAGGAHLVVGRFGWFNRYEIYVWTATLLSVAYLYRDTLVRAAPRGWNVRSALFALAFLVGVCFPYTSTLVLNAYGSANIYEQHYQMRRFATEFHEGPVAANDIGWLCYRNDEYVLDLWGLASRAALTLHAHQDVPGWVDTEWIREQTAARDVRLAMLFERWFPNLPENWVALGDLHLGRRRASAARSVVTFYAIGEENVASVRERLVAFEKTLPGKVRFVFREGIAQGDPARERISAITGSPGDRRSASPACRAASAGRPRRS